MHFLGAFEEDIYPCNCAIERKYCAHLSSCQKHCYWSSTQSCKAHKIKCNFSHYEPDVFVCILSTYWLEKFMVIKDVRFFYDFWRYLSTYQLILRCTVLSVLSTYVTFSLTYLSTYSRVQKSTFIWSVWCKMVLAEVGVWLPWWCLALLLPPPGYWGHFLTLKIFS